MVAHSSVYCYTLSYVFIYAFLLSLCVYFGSHNLLELWVSSSMHTYHFTPSTFPFYLTSKTRDLLTINHLFHSPRVSTPDNLWRISQNRSISQLIPYMTVSHWVTNYQHHNFDQQKWQVRRAVWNDAILISICPCIVFNAVNAALIVSTSKETFAALIILYLYELHEPGQPRNKACCSFPLPDYIDLHWV